MGEGKNLRAALVAAQSEVSGLVFKAGANQEQRYRYVGHEDVIEHSRKALVKHGVVIIQTSVRFCSALTWTTKSGERLAWLWESTFEVLHAESDEQRTVTVQVSTMPNDKASFVASTAADRTLLMRLMRLAGTSEENPEDDSHDDDYRRKQQGGSPPTQRSQPSSQASGSAANATNVLKTLHSELASWSDFAGLADLHNHALEKMDECRVSEPDRQKFWDAWGARCQALKLNPAAVAASANRKRAA